MRSLLRPFAAAVSLAALLVSGCRRGEAAPEPTLSEVFPAISTELMTMSSPALADLDGDGVADIVYGTGVDRVRPEQGRYVFGTEPAIPGYVVAVSGATGQLLWKAPHTGDVYTTARFVDLNGDGVADVVMGGREGAFAAFSGVDGARLWRVDPAEAAQGAGPYGFFTPAAIGDVNGDGVQDLLVAYGGDDTRLPGEPRAVAFMVAVSGADGSVLASVPVPDGAESYSSIVTYTRADGEWFVFGTGGETHAGAAYRAPVASLLDGSFAGRVERLVAPGTNKGVIAPATLVDLNGDGETDIVINTFDGRLIALDGASATPLWEHVTTGEEAYHQPAVMRISRAGRLGLLVSRGVGEFPGYTGSVHRIFDALDGSVVYEYRNDMSPGGAPLAVDITGDGIDEPFFFSVRYPRGHSTRVHILHGRSRTLIGRDIAANLVSTPLIADPRGTGTLELIGTAWTLGTSNDPPDWRDLTSHLLRLDLSVPAPSFRGWAGYMGTDVNGHYPPRQHAR